MVKSYFLCNMILSFVVAFEPIRNDVKFLKTLQTHSWFSYTIMHRKSCKFDCKTKIIPLLVKGSFDAPISN